MKMLDEVQAIKKQDEHISDGLEEHMSKLQAGILELEGKIVSGGATTMAPSLVSYRDFWIIGGLMLVIQIVFSLFRMQ